MHADAPQLSLAFYADAGRWDLVHEVACALGRPTHEPCIIRCGASQSSQLGKLMLHHAYQTSHI